MAKKKTLDVVGESIVNQIKLEQVKKTPITKPIEVEKGIDEITLSKIKGRGFNDIESIKTFLTSKYYIGLDNVEHVEFETWCKKIGGIL